jgi:hypothetical protein
MSTPTAAAPCTNVIESYSIEAVSGLLASSELYAEYLPRAGFRICGSILPSLPDDFIRTFLTRLFLLDRLPSDEKPIVNSHLPFNITQEIMS